MSQTPRQRTAKGQRPHFFDDPDIDKLFAIVMALTGEVSALRERLDTHERIAAAGQVATPEAIEAFEPDERTEDDREAWRAAYLDRVFRIIRAEPTGEEEEYGSLVTRFGGDKA